MRPEEAANQVDDEECGTTGMPLSSQETVSSYQPQRDEKILHIVLDIDTDGDQILPADDEQEIILRRNNPGGEESSRIHRVADTDDLCDKYPDIPAAGSFDTAETESSVDGSEASTDAGEISRPTNQEEQDTDSVRPLRATDVMDAARQCFQAARKKMKDVLNWCKSIVLFLADRVGDKAYTLRCAVDAVELVGAALNLL